MTSHSGHDMPGMSDTSTSSAMHMGMKMYFHATLPSTDAVWFASWIPSGVGAVIGTSIGLFFLGAVSRLLLAVQRGSEWAWKERTMAQLDRTRTDDNYVSTASSNNVAAPTRSRSEDKTVDDILPSAHAYPPIPSLSTDHSTQMRYRKASYLPPGLERMMRKRNETGNRGSVPFVWKNDLPRAGLEMMISAMHYLLMLVVMTFNVYFCVAVVLGIGFGELLFGRHGRR